MDLKDIIRRWRALADWEQKARRIESIPKRVVRSMAFEGDPLPSEWLAENQKECDALAAKIRRKGTVPAVGDKIE